MPTLSGHLQNNRILIKVGIRQFEPIGPVAGQSTIPSLDYVEAMALVDTGARRTCISEQLVQKLRMRRIGQTEVWNVKRPERHWTYLFHVGIWPDTELGVPSTIFGIGEEIEGIDIGNHPYFDVLLGMDIISQGRLLVEPNGDFTITFGEQ
ncbi:hypothetical protein P7228_06215 [Altererythrobacter arenosus]|uniref:Peptidase A2 domain-containing protein n=1 Tax=Altererythrobacter arenosus TaxID=3032592 RepID=A0ABY8FWP9_9SPHN|nr:hypothetical protein [Altererythrobacter sp. CAU 1644]WFL78655.1 hypothetical protein P7228_06215 [Altererythrobacter sp. CAU 1644]